MRTPRALLTIALAVTAATLVPGAATGAAPRAAAAPAFADWTTYHGSNYRDGLATTMPAVAGSLRIASKVALDGQVYASPIVVRGVTVVATENNTVYAFDANRHQLWKTHLGPPSPSAQRPCGNIDPLGVTGTPAYDASTGRVFVAAETTGGHHTLWALDPADGSRQWHRTLDTQTDRTSGAGRNILAEQERGAVLVSHGRVVTVFGGLAGDCDNYVGYATSVPADGSGPTTSYAVPTAREAGMWATPGAVEGPDGSVLVASGNGAEVGGAWDGSDSVIQLDPTTMERRSVFAPSSWPADNRMDLDLGSMSPAVVRARDRVVIAGKRGEVYLLAAPFGGIGSQLASTGGCHAYGGSAVVGSTVLLPCLGEHAIRALTVGATSIRWAWSAKGVYGAPVVAGDRVYVADRDSGDLVVLSSATGKQVWRGAAGPLPHFPSQVVSGDWVFVPTLDGVTAFRGR